MEFTNIIFYILEFLGTGAFAVSGAMVAISKQLDVFGVALIGLATALCGGIIRDIIVGNLPPLMFFHYEYALVAIVVSLLVFVVAYHSRETYQRNWRAINTVNNIFDALGLGAFTISGVNIGIEAGFATNAFMVIFLGLITGIGGGMIRDVLCQEIPLVLTKQVYALASIAGGLGYYLLYLWQINTNIAIFAGVGIVFLIRMLATKHRWHLPRVL